MGVVTLATLALAASPAFSDADRRWTLRLEGGVYQSSGDAATWTQDGAAGPETARLELTDGSGFGAGLEYRVTRRFGLDVSVMFGSYGSDFRVDTATGSLLDSEDIDTSLHTLGVNYHFRPEHRWDIYVGGFVAMAAYDGVIYLSEPGRRDKLTWDDDIGFGARLGVDAPFRAGSPWVGTAQLRFLATILESEFAGRDLDLDPLIATVGIGRRW
jgi:hypothetical protein